MAILYLSPVPACRHCSRLAYESTRENDLDRVFRLTEQLRARLGWEPGIFNGPTGDKPEHMHWKTFLKLAAAYDDLTGQLTRMIIEPPDLRASS